MSSFRRALSRGVFAAVAVVVLAIGYLQGRYQRLALSVGPLDVNTVEAVFSALTLAGFFVVSGTLFLYDRRVDRDPAATTDGGSVAAIVPVYHDADVLHRSVESLLAGAYDDLTVWIVPEPDDTESRERASELAAEDDRVEVLVNDKHPGSKAGAINYAVSVTDSDHVAVFDADEVVDPQFLSTAVAKLDDADLVQGRTIPEPTGFVESVAYVESILLNFVAQRFLYFLTDFRLAASRAVVMTREGFRRTEGYHTEMLTEDFEFAHRCYKHDLTVVEQLAAPSKIEAAHSLRDWWGQRKRWMTGYAQASHYLLGDIRPLRELRNPISAIIGAGTVGASLFMLSLVPKFVVLAQVGAWWLIAATLSLLFAITLAVQRQDYRGGLVDSVGWSWLVVPFVFPLYSLVAIKGTIDYLVSWEGEWYSVVKTGATEAD
ncbi:glycosyltransferase [Halapricum sp. CBA1109]|uniref:glycosyltransferase n=1 Tax=Halapricum sp. CBA1109 TaxID=2668068 RepID=UPI0012F92B8D|nr:glycosyltransferase family 2 protein [Halapricum sp. CBA1109]MUV90008.1 glycosyltransferase [Halapricum sp. CBA1109]